MRNARCLSALLVSAFLLLAAPLLAAAAPDAAPQTTPAGETTPATAPASDSEGYAAREAQDPAAADFKGGDSIVILGSTLAIVLLVILVIVIL
jgi:hypothetical protein